MAEAAPAAATPTPRRLYIHDDLSAEVRASHGPDSPAFALVEQLLGLVSRDRGRVRVLTLEEQILLVLARGAHAPFAMTIGIGRAGERVARQLHARAGWFPAIRRVDVAREENGAGGYRLVVLGGRSLVAQLADLEGAAAVAIVDDTVFSGLTMATILDALPPAVPTRTHAFCLRGVAESLPAIQARCPVTAGFVAPGRILHDVSFINASGLVHRGAIRRAGRPPLAFFERPEWIHAWFPGHGDEVIALCRRLHHALEGSDPARVGRS